MLVPYIVTVCDSISDATADIWQVTFVNWHSFNQSHSNSRLRLILMLYVCLSSSCCMLHYLFLPLWQINIIIIKCANTNKLLIRTHQHLHQSCHHSWLTIPAACWRLNFQSLSSATTSQLKLTDFYVSILILLNISLHFWPFLELLQVSLRTS